MTVRAEAATAVQCAFEVYRAELDRAGAALRCCDDVASDEVVAERKLAYTAAFERMNVAKAVYEAAAAVYAAAVKAERVAWEATQIAKLGDRS